MKTGLFLTGLILLSALNVSAQSDHAEVDVAGGEYFVDTDPGVGVAQRLNAKAGENSYVLSLDDITPGAHIFGIRIVDNSGRWTHTITRPLYIAAAEELSYAAMEYFIDNDPGKGNGSKIESENSQIVHFRISTANIPVGTHTLSVRLQDDQGQWSDVMTRPFVVIEKIPETGLVLEYFYGDDPGVGLARRVLVSEGENVFYLPLDESLDPGAHVFGVRCMDKEGNWSHTVVNPLYIVHPVSLGKAEYFVDDDPGFGNGNAVAMNGDGKSSFAIPTDNLKLGTHRLVLRANPGDNQWVELFSCPFDITGQSGINAIEWKHGFSYERNSGELMLYTEEIPSGSRVTVISIDGRLLTDTCWNDTSLPLSLNVGSTAIVIVRIVTPMGEIYSRTIG